MTATRPTISEADKQNILFLIKQSKKMLKSADMLITIPSNFAQIEYAVVIEELRIEIQKLERLFLCDPKIWHDEFKELCKSREQQNNDTCLSFTAIPEGICNHLYWNLADILYKPKSIADMLAILLPSIQSTLIFQTADILLPKTEATSTLQQRTVYSLEVKPLNELVNFSYSPIFFTEIVSDSNLVFPLQQVRKLPFYVHQKLFELLDEHPIIKKHFYTHNDHFQELHQDLDQNVASPNDEINKLVRELTRAGSRYSGLTDAAQSVLIPCARFSMYLDKLPATFKENLLAVTTTNNIKLSDIIGHLENGSCVEEAARNLKSIQENKNNAEILASLPIITHADQKLTQKKYRKAIPINGFEHTKILPFVLKKQILTNVIISSTADYIDILLNLPTEEYADFFKEVQISCDPVLPVQLGSSLQMFSSQQLEAFLDALSYTSEKFGGILSILELAIGSANLASFRKLFNLLTTENQIPLLYKHKQCSLIEMIVRDGTIAILETALESLPPEQRKTLIKSKTSYYVATPLHTALYNPDSEMFNKISSYYDSEELFEAMLNEKNHYSENIFHTLIRKGNLIQIKNTFDTLTAEQKTIVLNSQNSRVLHLAAQISNSPILFYLLSCLPIDQLINSIVKTDNNNYPLLSFCETQDLTLFDKDLLSSTYDMFWQAILTTVTDDGNTAFHYAAKSKHINNIFILLDLLPKPKQVLALLSPNKKGFTSIIHVAECQNAKTLQKLLQCFDNEDSLKLIEQPYFANGSRLIHFAAQSNADPLSIKVILDFYPATFRLEKIMEKNNLGKEPLFFAANNNSEIAKYILSLYPESMRLSAVTQTFDNGSILHQKNITTALALVDLLSIEDKKKAFSHVDNEKSSVLQQFSRQINRNNILEFNKLMAIYSHAEKYIAFTHKDIHGYMPLHDILSNPNISLDLLNGFTSTELLTMVSMQNCDGKTLAHLIVNGESHIHRFTHLLSFCSSTDRFKILMLRDRHGLIVFNYACRFLSPLSLSSLLKMLDKKDLLALKQAEFNEKHSLLESAAININPGVFNIILKLYPTVKRNDVLFKKNAHGNSLFHLAATHNSNPVALKSIFLLAPQSQLARIITEPNKAGYSPLHLAARKNNPAVVKTILSLLPESERMYAAKAEDINGNILLHHAARNATQGVCKLVFELYENGLLALQHQNKQGFSPFHYAASNIATLNYMLELNKDFAQTLLHFNKHGHTLFYYATKSSNPFTLEIMLNALQIEDRCVAIMKNNLLHVATQCPRTDTLIILLKHIPENKRLEALETKNSNNKTPWHYAKYNKNSEMLRTLINHLSKDDQITHQQKTNTETISLYSLFYPAQPGGAIDEPNQAMKKRR